jgi:membrane associated rhomboid family serine protease
MRVEALMIVLLAAALAGGLSMLAALWPYGAVAALTGASFGGSVSALLAGLMLALLRARARRRRGLRRLPGPMRASTGRNTFV